MDVLGNGFNTLSIDMATVDSILQNSEDDAALTASEMNLELANAIKGFGGAPTNSPPRNSGTAHRHRSTSAPGGAGLPGACTAQPPHRSPVCTAQPSASHP